MAAGAAMSPWRKRRDISRQARGETMAKANPGEWIRQVQAEMRKVVWPTRQETTTTAIFVALMMVLLSVFFLGIDSVFGYVVNWLLKVA
jgi:preprotein translocase subunit SecE